MHNVYDQYAKDALYALLSPAGPVKTEQEVSPDAQRVDLYFAPDATRGVRVVGMLTWEGGMNPDAVWPDFARNALKVGACAKAKGLHDAIAKLLLNPDRDVRYAAVEALEQVGIGPLEPVLKTILRDRPQGLTYPFISLYRLLLDSDDPELALAFKNSLVGADISQSTAFLNAVATSRKPWVLQLLLDLANTEGLDRWPAFVTLAAWGPQTEPDLLKICIAALEKIPPVSEQLKRRRYIVDLEECRKYLGRLAGRDRYSTEETDAALAYARAVAGIRSGQADFQPESIVADALAQGMPKAIALMIVALCAASTPSMSKVGSDSA